jgi:hypothetical protein
MTSRGSQYEDEQGQGRAGDQVSAPIPLPSPVVGARRHPLRLAPLTCRSLAGTRARLPRDLPGVRTLVLLAYRQRHQADVDRWIALAVALGVPATPRGAPEPLATAVVEVPFLAGGWRPVRRVIDGGMATGVADPDVLARTFTAYGSPRAHRRASGIDAERRSWLTRGHRRRHALATVEALVCERDGTVRWHRSGRPTPDDTLSLAASLGLA